MIRALLAALTLIVVTSKAAAQQPTARDTLLSRRIWVACDSLTKWKVSQQPVWYKRQISICKANADSVKLAPPAPANTAPIASFTVPAEGCMPLQICTFRSTSTDDQGATNLRYEWNCNVTPACNSTGAEASAIYPSTASGQTRTVTLKVTDAGGLFATITRTVSIGIVPAPDSVVNDTTPVPPVQDSLGFDPPKPVQEPMFAKAIRVIPVNATTSDLQAVLNASQQGDSVVISGDFPPVTLPTRPCGGAGITITSAAPALPKGTRQTPTTKTGRIISNSAAESIHFASPTCGWKIDGIEVVLTSPGTTLNYAMIGVGDGGSVNSGQIQTSLDKVPRDIVLSHLYVHGLVTSNSTRCIALQSANTIVRDSYVSDCHAKGFDSQAIEGWNGPGPFLIENNYLEGAGENLMFGGATPGIAGLRPSDITIRRNHFIKKREWQGLWVIKNLLELKNANRVLIERNYFQDIWPSGQEGMAIVLKSSQGQETNPISLPEGTTNVLFQGNVIDTAAVAIDVHASDCYPTCPTIATNRVVIRGNVARNIGLPGEGRAAGMLITKQVADIVVTGNSFFHHPSVLKTRGSAITFDYGNARRLTFTNNFFDGGAYQVFFGGKIGTAALDSMAGVGNWTFSGNAVAYGTASKFPSGNTFPAASTMTSGVGADVQAVLNGVAGVVVPQPVSLRRRRRVPRIDSPSLTNKDKIRLKDDPSDPDKPSNKIKPVKTGRFP